MSEMPMKSSLPAPGTGTLVYAHRGAMAYAPQNTMPSFELAWEMGAHGIELDVQCARDGVPVVFHDDEIGSLTGGQGAIRDHDLAEIRKLDAGSHFSKKFAGEKIPLFEDVLRARPAGTFINIELKTKIAEEDSILRQMLRPITGYPALDFGMDGANAKPKPAALRRRLPTASRASRACGDQTESCLPPAIRVRNPARSSWHILLSRVLIRLRSLNSRRSFPASRSRFFIMAVSISIRAS